MITKFAVIAFKKQFFDGENAVHTLGIFDTLEEAEKFLASSKYLPNIENPNDEKYYLLPTIIKVYLKDSKKKN